MAAPPAQQVWKVRLLAQRAQLVPTRLLYHQSALSVPRVLMQLLGVHVLPVRREHLAYQVLVRVRRVMKGHTLVLRPPNVLCVSQVLMLLLVSQCVICARQELSVQVDLVRALPVQRDISQGLSPSLARSAAPESMPTLASQSVRCVRLARTVLLVLTSAPHVLVAILVDLVHHHVATATT